MNGREIKEIRNTLEFEECSIGRFCGCYVGYGGNVTGTWNRLFLDMEKADIHGYLAILKKCLSGKLDRTLFNVSVGEEQEIVLGELLKSRLGDETYLEKIYRHIIDRMNFLPGGHLIMGIHDTYDVPGKGKDNTVMEDASEEAYPHILMCICPVKASVPQFEYNPEKGMFARTERKAVLEEPEMAILYPAFNGRGMDMENALVYVKKMDSEKEEFLRELLGIQIPDSPKKEMAIFNKIMKDVLGTKPTTHEILAVSDAVAERAGNGTEDDEPERIGRAELEEILQAAGIRQSKIDRLPETFGGRAGRKTGLSIENIVKRGNVVVKTESGELKCKKGKENYADIEEKEGRYYLTMELEPGTIHFNGIEIKIGGEE